MTAKENKDAEILNHKIRSKQQAMQIASSLINQKETDFSASVGSFGANVKYGKYYNKPIAEVSEEIYKWLIKDIK